MSRATVLGVSLSLGLLASLACDRKWDFECTSVWEGRTGNELARKVYSYPQMADEQAATARCEEDMLKDRPKGGKAATCHCVGQE
ncbi:MAG: hypothetical protein KC431_20080 [Myxococcales bacterium]|nr:hypothetical protein [Myxococcales bacterium]